jgi:hypothetical protein
VSKRNSDISRHLPLDAALELDALCELFDVAWRGPTEPCIEAFLGDNHHLLIG